MTAANPPVSQTRSFSTVFLIELWERFGFYGMQALIVFYMVQRLNFQDARANIVWSAAAALIYVAPAIGGWIGDKVLGTRRTMLMGAFILGLGYALMAIPSENTWALFGALSVIVVGNGLFKPNAGNLVRKIYEGDDSKIDSAFTIYYMAVNIGSTVSMLLTPKIKDWVNAAYHSQFGWHAAFGVCALGLLVGLTNYFFMRKAMAQIGSAPDERPVNVGKLAMVLVGAMACAAGAAAVLQYEELAKIFVYGAGVVLLGIFAYLIGTSHRDERAGLTAALILVVQTIFFFVFYQQMSTSLNLFALRNVDWSCDLFGYHLLTWTPEQFQAFNPIWIMLLSPVLAWAYTHFGKQGRDLSVAAKFACGFAAVAIGFYIYGVAAQFTTQPGRTNSWVMVWGYGFGSLGELLTSGLGLAMIARYVPARMGGFMMGAYFVASGISQYFGGMVANLASVPDAVGKIVANSPGAMVSQVQQKLPGVMAMKLEDFRDWLLNHPGADKIAATAHLPAFSSMPHETQALLTQFNEHLYTTTMPIYTHLFALLGTWGVAITIASFAMVWPMRKLSAIHQSAGAAAERPEAEVPVHVPSAG
ncbi:MAG TPA: oligopeptide:H+ symporter [Xanthomonadaceae bacterium]|jgi:POT family proton-dependent oligopeptide transporter